MNRPNQRESTEMLLSQLADGELPADRAGRVLADVLDDADARELLKGMLRLRLALDPWRRQEPSRAIVVPPARPARSTPHSGRWLVSLAAAALVGGVLVACGFYLGGRLAGGRPDGPIAGQSEDPASQPRPAPREDRLPALVVTPDQRREIAQAFALHESVAGPLSWYAADDSSIELAAARKSGATHQPIAVVLRLVPAGLHKQGEAKTYVIVCRSDGTAAIDLPDPEVARAVRLRLHGTVTEGHVDLHYAIAADGSDRGPDGGAALAGRRRIGLGQTPLGQLPLEDCLVSVDASAWVIHEQLAP